MEKIKEEKKGSEKEVKSLRISLDKQKHEITKHLKTIEDLERQKDRLKDQQVEITPKPSAALKSEVGKFNRLTEELEKYKSLYSASQDELKTVQMDLKRRSDDYENNVFFIFILDSKIGKAEI